MRSSTPKPLRKRWLLALIAAMVLLLFLVPAVQAAPDASPQASGSCGYWYTVKSGDSWTKLASWTGVSVSALKAANPSHIHPYNWLYIGHTLWIPCGQPYPPHPPPPPHPPQPPHPPHPPSGCGYWYTVQYGDSWSKLAARTGISMYTLKGANPAHIHPYNWLYAGHRLWIPCAQPYPPHPQPPHPPHPQPPHPPQPPMCQYYYTVLPGDSWYSVCNKTGVSVSALQNANPSKVRPPNYWLYAGETLCIPGYAY